MIEVTDQAWSTAVLESKLPVIVDFWATWCPPCRMFAPIFEQLSREFEGKVLCVKVDTDKNPGVASQHRITNIPTVMFVKDGAVVGQVMGLQTLPQMRDLINRFFGEV